MLAPARARTVLLTTAVFGIALGVALRFGEGPGASPVSRVLTLAVLGVVPLVLAVAPSGGEAWDRLVTMTAFVLPPAGLAAVGALWADTGVTGGGLASAWMGLAILVAIVGVSGLSRPEARRDPRAWTVTVALLYLPVGAGWLVMARMGLSPLGFDPMIVVLTAVHFHFAALVGPVLAARAAGVLEGRTRRVAIGSGLAVVAAMPIVAAGLVVSPGLALVGAVVLAVALLALAAVTLLGVVPALRRRGPKALLAISALSLLLSMPLAVVYAYGQVAGTDPIGLEWMVRLHGFANAHGFAVCGLLAWAIEDRA